MPFALIFFLTFDAFALAPIGINIGIVKLYVLVQEIGDLAPVEWTVRKGRVHSKRSKEQWQASEPTIGHLSYKRWNWQKGARKSVR
jgi:hypothetical protein